MMRSQPSFCLFFCCAMLFTFQSSLKAEWPEFRGPSGQGLVKGAKLPIHFDEENSSAWKQPIPGKGWSSPVILDNTIWLTTAVESILSEEEKEQKLKEAGLPAKRFDSLQAAAEVSLFALSINFKTGKIEKEIPLFSILEPEQIHSLNSFSSPTPILEENRIYCHFGTNGTACIDTDTGEVLWRREIHILHSVGAGSSPVLYKDLLILVCDGLDQQFVTALNKNTGETVWRTDRPPLRTSEPECMKSYCTPLIIKFQGKDQMIIPGAQWFVSYDPQTGKEIWRVDHGRGWSIVPRPVYEDGIVYATTGYPSAVLWAIRVDGKGDVTETHTAWKEPRQIPFKPSPVLTDGKLFMVSDLGIASCYEAKTGKKVWMKRLGGNYSASPISNGEHLYFSSQEGKITVIKASDEYEVVSESELDGQIMASPVVEGESILLRTDQALYRFDYQ
ncbi:Outer membrane biogenesis protein BamB [Planctomycetales bacterium 10988]|nr:Outer membrane biogenesis protein BamB [Planctomycetales bacterium 10988]